VCKAGSGIPFKDNAHSRNRDIIYSFSSGLKVGNFIINESSAREPELIVLSFRSLGSAPIPPGRFDQRTMDNRFLIHYSNQSSRSVAALFTSTSLYSFQARSSGSPRGYTIVTKTNNKRRASPFQATSSRMN